VVILRKPENLAKLRPRSSDIEALAWTQSQWAICRDAGLFEATVRRDFAQRDSLIGRAGSGVTFPSHIQQIAK